MLQQLLKLKRCYVITCHDSESADFKPNNVHNSNKSNELVLCLFSALENDSDLRMIVEKWSKLSVELRKAIVRMVR